VFGVDSVRMVEVILTGDFENGCVRLAAPFDQTTIDLGTFALGVRLRVHTKKCSFSTGRGSIEQ
jgi:hypothetical protein